MSRALLSPEVRERTYIGSHLDHYWFARRPIVVHPRTNSGLKPPPYRRLLMRVLTSIYSAKALHAQLSDIPLRSDTQALRLIAGIPLIQRKEKHHSREGKSTFP